MRSAIKYQDKHKNEVIFVTSDTLFPTLFLQKKRQSESYGFRSTHNFSPSNQPFTFTGKKWCKSQWLAQRGLERGISETGYGHFGARYMDNELMTMWLSVDPMADKYPSLSPYNYCAWNPVKQMDPDGREIDNWIINVATGEISVEKTDNNYVTIIANNGKKKYSFPDGDFSLNVDFNNCFDNSSCEVTALGGTKYDNAYLHINCFTDGQGHTTKISQMMDGIMIPDYLAFKSKPGWGVGFNGILCGIIGLSFNIGYARDGMGESAFFVGFNYAVGVEAGIGISGFRIESGKGINSIAGENQIIEGSALLPTFGKDIISNRNYYGLGVGLKAGASVQIGKTWSF